MARNQFHRQEYFPLWLESPLTFQGTLLPKNAWDKSGKDMYWVLNAYDYGYVDNKPNLSSATVTTAPSTTWPGSAWTRATKVW